MLDPSIGRPRTAPRTRVRNALLLCAMLAVALLGAIFRGDEWYTLTVLSPALLIVSAGAHIATFAVLLSVRRYTAYRVATLFLAGIYGAWAAMQIFALLQIRLDPRLPPVSPQMGNTIAYLMTTGRLLIGIGAFGYFVLHRRDDAVRLTRWGVRGIVSAPFAGALVVTGGVFVLAPHLAPILHGTVFTPAYRWVVAPFVAGVCFVVAALLWRSCRTNEIDTAFTYAVLAVGIEEALDAIGGTRDSTAWYLARIFNAGAATAVLVAAICMLVRARDRLRLAEAALVHAQREAERHAGRLRSLWQIAAIPAKSYHARLAMVLDAGARTIRPGRRMFGYVSHLVDGNIVVDAASDDGGTSLASRVFRPGAIIDFERSLNCIVFAEGGTHAWNDLRAFSGRAMICEQVGWRSLIATPMRIEGRTHFVMFGSPDEMHDAPFGEDDIAYMDVLAAFVMHDVASQHQRDQVQFALEHDPLTGLKNREAFRSAVVAAVAAGEPFALLFVDLDRFRAFNETAGTETGDGVLVDVAAALNAVDPRDTVARRNGDGFGVLVRNVATLAAAHARAGAYAALFRPAYPAGGPGRGVTASVAAARYPADGISADALLRSADAALDAAKSRGGNTLSFYEPVMAHSARQRNLPASELSHAIDGGDLTLAYQPTYELATQRINGAEALVRWNHATRGQLLPKDFIELAERSALTGRIALWVLDRVCADLRRLPAIPDGWRCHINISTAQIDDVAFLTQFEQRLQRSPALARHLAIEITETAAINNTENSIYALERFRALGLLVAIDDFGTGYSSLAYLKRLPVDMIKIDRAFVTGLPGDEKDAALCEILLQIAARFELATLAEGIETYAQQEWLRAHGCRFGQGFLVAEPMPFAELALRLAHAPAVLRASDRTKVRLPGGANVVKQ